MTDAFLLGALSTLGVLVLVVEVALSLSSTTRIFRVALGTAIIGGTASLALEPGLLHLAFLSGAAILGALGGAVCALVMVVDGIVRGGRRSAGP